jgi:effector-binding domain-containing protein
VPADHEDGTGRRRDNVQEIEIEKAASTVHTGPYEDIEPAYEALADWMFENGYEPIGTAYEFYLNDPGTTSSEDLQTVIFMPVVNTQVPENQNNLICSLL